VLCLVGAAARFAAADSNCWGLSEGSRFEFRAATPLGERPFPPGTGRFDFANTPSLAGATAETETFAQFPRVGKMEH